MPLNILKNNRFLITLGLSLVISACGAVTFLHVTSQNTAIAIMLIAALGLILVITFQTREVKRLRAQFFEAQKMEAIGRLAGGIAHDFNNSLAAISGYAELLAEDLKTAPEQQAYAEKILLATAQSQKLIDQILAFSRKTQPTFDPVRASAICNDVISMLQATLRPKITLVTDIQEPDAFILANAGQIQQVIMNICVNAGDAIGKNPGKIILRSCKTDKDRTILQKIMLSADRKKDGSATLPQKLHQIDKKRSVMTVGALSPAQDYISIIVEDTGGGIPFKTLASIFDPFFTTKSTGKGKGTGLGLAAAHGIIATHHGALIVTTETGYGTTFEILLPTVQAPASTSAPRTAKSLPQGHGNLLLVEDDDIVATMMISGLERMGYDVIHCQNGQEALAALAAEPGHYRLMITDYKMPNMTGLDLSRQVSKIYPNMPIIMISGYSDEKLQAASYGTSIRRVLKKPVRMKLLSEVISEVLTTDHT